MICGDPILTQADAGASCADVPLPPPIDVAGLSRALTDGVYYAGRRLTPWMTFEERLELGGLEPLYTRDTTERRERYAALRKRREAESIVVRWTIEGGLPSAPVEVWGMHDEVTLAAPNRVRHAFLWGREPGHVDVYNLGHALIYAALEQIGHGARERGSNRYIDAMMKRLDKLGDTWVIALADVVRLVHTIDLRLAHAKFQRVLADAREAGVDVDAVLAAGASQKGSG